jgi:hypothetical protein
MLTTVSCNTLNNELNKTDIRSIVIHEINYSLEMYRLIDTTETIITEKYYNNLNQLYKKKIKNVFRNIEEVTHYSYDKNILTNDSIFDVNNNNLIAKNKYLYPDSNSVVIQSTIMNLGQNIKAYNVQTINNGYLQKEVMTLPSKHSLSCFSVEYKYNEKTIIQKKRSSNTLKSSIIYNYEYIDYDNRGNWIKRVIKKDNIPYKIQYRKIQYNH